MTKQVWLVLITFLLFLSAEAAVPDSPARSIKEAKRLVLLGNYKSALPYLQQVFRSDSSNAYFNYLLGTCMYNIPAERNGSVKFLKRATQNTTAAVKEWSLKEKKAPYKAWLYYGMSLQYNYNFLLAITAYKKYDELSAGADKKDVTQYIYSCENAVGIVKDSIDISIENLGFEINSEYDEHTPVINGDENIIIFTSRRKEGTTLELADDGRFFEDIYISRKENNRWTKPVGISKNINTPQHDASICLSYDGTELYIYKDDMGNGNIYVSRLESGVWSVPVKLGPNINSEYNETHAALSPDGQLLIFTSDRPGGLGGRDLYYCSRLPNGEWGNAINMGDKINTPFNEEGPYFHPDGFTLYFSSTGHNNIGGYDLFSSELQTDGTWSDPVNMGYPINTTDDELFFVLSTDGKRAYFSSIHADGFGGKDLYVMNLLSVPEKCATVLKGAIKVAGTEEIPSDLTISIKDLNTNKVIGKYKPNKETGIYTMILRQGRQYEFNCESVKCRFTPEIITIPDKSAFDIIHRPIELNPIGFVEKVE